MRADWASVLVILIKFDYMPCRACMQRLERNISSICLAKSCSMQREVAWGAAGRPYRARRRTRNGWLARRQERQRVDCLSVSAKLEMQRGLTAGVKPHRGDRLPALHR